MFFFLYNTNCFYLIMNNFSFINFNNAFLICAALFTSAFGALFYTLPGWQNKTYERVTHVIFDVDNTVLSVDEIYKEADTEIIEHYGKKYQYSLKLRTAGRSRRERAQLIVKELKLPCTAEEFESLSREYYFRLLPEAEVKPGVLKLCHHLAEHGVLMALATSGCQDDLIQKFRYHDQLFGLFHHVAIVGEYNSTKYKPAPDVFLMAAEKFPDKPSPNKCLVFDDMADGVEAARNASMQVVYVPCDKGTPQYEKEKATLAIETLNEFIPELFGLPPFPK